MVKLTISTGGRITLPLDLREHLEVGPGDSIVVTKLPHGRVELQSAHSKGKIADIFGLLKQDRTPLTVEDMNRIAARGWAGKR